MNPSQKITPFLWFDGRAVEAAKFYTSIFNRSKILSASPTGATFRLEGQEFMALNGGPGFPFTQAISLFVSCKTQKEVDTLWRRLSRGGEVRRCGWLKDKFGLSWQIIPTVLGDLLYGKDRGRAQRAMTAMLGMQKLDIRALRRAADG